MIDKTKNESEKNTGTKGEDIIAGRNAVNEALRSGRTIDSLYVVRGQKTGSLTALIAKAKQKDITIKEADAKKLDFMCGNANHQGVVAVAAIKEYADLDDIFQLAQSRGEAPFIIICDELEDPHNLGAVIRSAEAGGAHGIIIPKRRNASLSYTVGKASAGALEYLPVARVSNLVSTIRDLQKAGVWVFGTAADGDTGLYAADLKGPAAIVIGNEGAGMSRLVSEACDFKVSIPMHGRISSLNASNAAAILLYEAVRQRG